MERGEAECDAQPTLRVGVVSFVNARPLDRYLHETLPRAAVIRERPSRLADWLRAGKIDIGLVPVIELAKIDGSRIAGNACIACRGEVGSVRLFSRVAPQAIRSLALDHASRTSNTLARILLAEQHGLTPTIVPIDAEGSPENTVADAVVVIGDRAIAPPWEGSFSHVLDLGREWLEWTGLPFVFAAWIARRGVEPTRWAEAFNAARDRGVGDLETIAAEESTALDLSADRVYRYLSRQLRYHLGPDEVEAISLFLTVARRRGLLASRSS